MPDLIDVDEFFADPQFANPSISPDGTRITYLAPDQGGGRDGCAASTRTTPTRSASLATSAAASPHTTGPTTPAGCFYLQDVDGNEDWHLHRGDLDDPDALTVDLTPIDAGSRVVGVEPFRPCPAPCWSR